MSRPRDRGIVLVIVALCLTVLLIFAAFAVDIGAARSARRKAQGVVDASALAGGQFLITADGTLAATTGDAIADEIIAVTYLNFSNDATMTDVGSLTEEEWRSRFATCTDPDRNPARFPVRSTVSACISFNNPITRVRVRLPDLHVPTYFAGVIGIDSLTTHADAEVELVPDNSAGLLPFGLPTANADDPEICLKSKNQPSLPPCDGPEEGNFGNLDLSWYGNPVLGTTTVCSADTQTRLAANIAIGVDHVLSTYLTGMAINDRDECPDLAIHPNEVMAQTGVGSSLDQGLITGLGINGHAVTGRLTRGPWADRHVRGSWTLDDRPLWEFIDPALTAAEVPAQCVPGTISTRALMVQCLVAYGQGTYPPLFTRDDDSDGRPDILQSPRLAWVPQLHAQHWGQPDTTPQNYRIRAFRPIFLQTLYFSCSNNAHGQAGCDGFFDPGEGDFYFNPGTGTYATSPLPENKTLEAVTALLLTEDMVGPAVVAAGPGGPRTYDLVLRR